MVIAIHVLPFVFRFCHITLGFDEAVGHYIIFVVVSLTGQALNKTFRAKHLVNAVVPYPANAVNNFLLFVSYNKLRSVLLPCNRCAFLVYL